MVVILTVGTVGVLLSLGLGYAVYQAIRAQSRVLAGIEALRHEVIAAHRGGAEKYTVPMPGKRQFEDELHACTELLPILEERAQKLFSAGFFRKLTRRWLKDCVEIQRRCDIAVDSLQREAFWAQFKPGTEAHECRYKEDDGPIENHN